MVAGEPCLFIDNPNRCPYVIACESKGANAAREAFENINDEVAAYIAKASLEDALDHHLATKKMFSVAVWFMLERPEVYDIFVQYTVDGQNRLNVLVEDLSRAIGENNLKAMSVSDELLRGERPPVKGAGGIAGMSWLSQ